MKDKASESARKKKEKHEAAADGDEAVNLIVEESKKALPEIEQTPNGEESKDNADNRSASSFSSYDTIEGSGKYKCRACLLAFKSKKLLEKHRKTAEHKKREKKFAEDHAR